MFDNWNIWNNNSTNGIKKSVLTLGISNCLLSPTSENPQGISAWCVLVEFRANPSKNS